MLKLFILKISLLLFTASSAIASETVISAIQNADLNTFNQSKDQVTDWNIKDAGGNTLLILAFQTLNKLNSQNRGKTALHYAVMNNDIPMVERLIENGADVQVKDENGDTPYLLARKMRYHEIADIIFENLREENANDIAAGKTYKEKTDAGAGDKNTSEENEFPIKRKNIISILFTLIEKSGDINAPDKNGMNALHYAVLGGNYALVKELINKKIDINARDKIKSGTPLIMAARMGEWNIVNLLLENNADINLREKEKPETGNNKNETIIKEEEYLKPVEYNFKFIVYSEGIENPEKDARTYYQVFIDKQEQGRTSIGLDSQKKEYTALLSSNSHLIEVAKFNLDRKQEKYVRLNNIDQPSPDFFYFNIPGDRVVVITLKHNIADRKAGFSLHYAKKDETKNEPGPASLPLPGK